MKIRENDFRQNDVSEKWGGPAYTIIWESLRILLQYFVAFQT